jgi:hypothetical protein
MSNLHPDAPYDACNAVLNVARSAFTNKELQSYDSYVALEPPAEDCCGLLVAYTSGITPSFGIDENRDFGVYVYTIEIVIALRECTPPLKSDGSPPSGTEINTYAKKSSQNACRIINAILCARKAGNFIPSWECTFSTPPYAQVVEELGQCAGWDISMALELT